VLVDGNSLTVTVPTGGVKEGEVMSVPYPDGWSPPTVRSAPIGKWKVSCHPSSDTSLSQNIHDAYFSFSPISLLYQTEWIM